MEINEVIEEFEQLCEIAKLVKPVNNGSISLEDVVRLLGLNDVEYHISPKRVIPSPTSNFIILKSSSHGIHPLVARDIDLRSMSGYLKNIFRKIFKFSHIKIELIVEFSSNETLILSNKSAMFIQKGGLL